MYNIDFLIGLICFIILNSSMIIVVAKYLIDDIFSTITAESYPTCLWGDSCWRLYNACMYRAHLGWQSVHTGL